MDNHLLFFVDRLVVSVVISTNAYRSRAIVTSTVSTPEVATSADVWLVSKMLATKHAETLMSASRACATVGY